MMCGDEWKHPLVGMTAFMFLLGIRWIVEIAKDDYVRATYRSEIQVKEVGCFPNNAHTFNCTLSYLLPNGTVITKQESNKGRFLFFNSQTFCAKEDKMWSECSNNMWGLYLCLCIVCWLTVLTQIKIIRRATRRAAEEKAEEERQDRRIAELNAEVDRVLAQQRADVEAIARESAERDAAHLERMRKLNAGLNFSEYSVDRKSEPNETVEKG
jgi:hypothetical protein